MTLIRIPNCLITGSIPGKSGQPGGTHDNDLDRRQ
jgi:hypothetical protein